MSHLCFYLYVTFSIHVIKLIFWYTFFIGSFVIFKLYQVMFSDTLNEQIFPYNFKHETISHTNSNLRRKLPYKILLD